MHITEFKNWLLAAKEKYNVSKSFLESSRNDPPNEPYKSQYKAKEVLSQLVSEIETKWKRAENSHVTLLYVLFKYELGVIAVDTEEFGIGCDLLTSGWEEIKDLAEKTESCVLAINILNQLGILWSARGESTKALNYLLEAEKLYTNYKANNHVCPLDLEDIFVADYIIKNDWHPFEKAYTQTLFYLAQVYEHLNDSDNSAKYCHATLKRQRESGEFDVNEWAVNSATLSQYYIQKKVFEVARHLLACSSLSLSKYESTLDKELESEEKLDDLRRSKAEVAWCWLKYCINLLSSSKDIDCESKQSDETYRFSEDQEILEEEKKVPSNILQFEDARNIFLFGQEQVIEAKSYYTLNHHANNFVQLVQDHSKLYKWLASYESDLSRQCKMQKRRIDMLENVLMKLNPQYYLAVCRQLRFELGEIYYEMIDLKFKISGSSKPLQMPPQAIKKLNSLILQDIEHFKGFIDTLKDNSGNLPDVYSDDDARPVLVAFFFLGGLYSKLIDSDKSKKMHNLAESEKYYKLIVDYVEKNPSHADCIQVELPLIKEMIELMPEKMLQVAGSVLF